MKLGDVEFGRIVRVKRIMGGPKKRFLTMGITNGTSLRVVKKAPLGDPIEVEIRGYRLSLRKDEADYIEVE